MKRDQTLHGKNVFYSLLFPNKNTCTWWQFIFSWQEDHLVMKPRRRSIHRLLERLSLYWNHTQVTKRKRISPKTWWHKAQRAPIQTADLCAKNPYQRPAVRCCLARIIFILHLRCPRFHREKIAYTLVLHLTKKSQLIKAITSMYIMNNQEEKTSSFHCNHSKKTTTWWARIIQTSLALAKYNFRCSKPTQRTKTPACLKRYRCTTPLNTV